MKQFYLLLLATALATPAVTGQNILVITKDGVSHKFNADYVSELKFQEIFPPASPVDFDAVSVDPFSNGNVTLTFTNQEGQKAVLDFYGPRDATWLQSGLYTVNAQREDFSINPAYSEIFDGVKKNIAGGSAQVTADGRHYVVDFQLTLDDTSEYAGHFDGTLDTYTRIVSAQLTNAAYGNNAQGAGKFYIKLNDDAYKWEIALGLTATPDATELAEGTYTCTEDGGEMSLSRSVYAETYNPYALLHYMPGSQVTVSRTADGHRLELNLLFDDGRTGEFTFEGTISGTPKF